jgi:hypothetical protein
VGDGMREMMLEEMARSMRIASGHAVEPSWRAIDADGDGYYIRTQYDPNDLDQFADVLRLVTRSRFQATDLRRGTGDRRAFSVHGQTIDAQDAVRVAGWCRRAVIRAEDQAGWAFRDAPLSLA